MLGALDYNCHASRRLLPTIDRRQRHKRSVKDTPAEGYDYNRVYVPYRTTSDASPSGARPASRPFPQLAPGGGSGRDWLPC